MESGKSWDVLEVLLMVAEAGNFRAAAERLKLSPAAISLKLRALQEQHRAPIFSVEGRRKVLTHYGQALVEIARGSATRLAADLEELERQYSAGDALTLKVGGRAELMEVAGPRFDFKGRIEFLGMPSFQVLPALHARQIDIGLTPTKPDSAEIVAKKMFRSHSYLSFHESLRPGRVGEELLEDVDFLTRTPCIGYIHEKDMLTSWLLHVGADPAKVNFRCRTDDWHVVRAMVEAGIGYSILPVYIGVHHPKVRRIRIPERGIERLDFFAVYSTHLRKVPAFRELLAFRNFPLFEGV
jgi:DNA-binding transcriptional LysR family regulator